MHSFSCFVKYCFIQKFRNAKLSITHFGFKKYYTIVCKIVCKKEIASISNKLFTVYYLWVTLDPPFLVQNLNISARMLPVSFRRLITCLTYFQFVKKKIPNFSTILMCEISNSISLYFSSNFPDCWNRLFF